MAQVIDMVVDNRTPKEKVQSWWWGVTCKVKQAKEWVVAHPVETAMILTSVAAVTKQGIRTYDKLSAIHDDRVSRLTIWCNDVQGPVRLKHQLTNEENLALRNLMDQGYTKLQALNKLRLLK